MWILQAIQFTTLFDSSRHSLLLLHLSTFFQVREDREQKGQDSWSKGHIILCSGWLHQPRLKSEALGNSSGRLT